MTEIERAIRLANAKIAAWQLYGVPIEGEFRWSMSVAGVLRFAPLCTACKANYAEGNTVEPEAEALPLNALVLALWYRGVSRWVLHGCAHFVPLLEPEPPEVTALVPMLFLEDPALGVEP